jgi:hypothetical protein
MIQQARARACFVFAISKSSASVLLPNLVQAFLVQAFLAQAFDGGPR